MSNEKRKKDDIVDILGVSFSKKDFEGLSNEQLESLRDKVKGIKELLDSKGRRTGSKGKRIGSDGKDR